MAVHFNFFWSTVIFGRGIVVTKLRCSGIFKDEYAANLPLPVKEF